QGPLHRLWRPRPARRRCRWRYGRGAHGVDPALLTLGCEERGPKGSPKDFADLAARQRIDTVERDRCLVRREVGTAEAAQLVIARGTRRHDEGDGYLAETRVRYADNRGVGDTGSEPQDLLDLLREHLVAAAVDDVTRPALDPHEAVGVDAGEVASVDVPVGVDSLRDERGCR